MNNDDIVSRVYSNFRGVDFRGEEINLIRSPDSLNVWKDYKETESIRTRPGMALQEAFSEPVYGIFFYNGTQIVHSGKNLYKVSSAGVTFLGAVVDGAGSVVVLPVVPLGSVVCAGFASAAALVSTAGAGGSAGAGSAGDGVLSANPKSERTSATSASENCSSKVILP